MQACFTEPDILVVAGDRRQSFNVSVVPARFRARRFAARRNDGRLILPEITRGTGKFAGIEGHIFAITFARPIAGNAESTLEIEYTIKKDSLSLCSSGTGTIYRSGLSNVY
jgi:hypothetical protein